MRPACIARRFQRSNVRARTGCSKVAPSGVSSYGKFFRLIATFEGLKPLALGRHGAAGYRVHERSPGSSTRARQRPPRTARRARLLHDGDVPDSWCSAALVTACPSSCRKSPRYPLGGSGGAVRSVPSEANCDTRKSRLHSGAFVAVADNDLLALTLQNAGSCHPRDHRTHQT